jgi:hypothetical protein
MLGHLEMGDEALTFGGGEGSRSRGGRVNEKRQQNGQGGEASHDGTLRRQMPPVNALVTDALGRAAADTPAVTGHRARTAPGGRRVRYTIAAPTP